MRRTLLSYRLKQAREQLAIVESDKDATEGKLQAGARSVRTPSGRETKRRSAPRQKRMRTWLRSRLRAKGRSKPGLPPRQVRQCARDSDRQSRFNHGAANLLAWSNLEETAERNPAQNGSRRDEIDRADSGYMKCKQDIAGCWSSALRFRKERAAPVTAPAHFCRSECACCACSNRPILIRAVHATWTA